MMAATGEMGERQPEERGAHHGQEFSTRHATLWTLAYLLGIGLLASRHVLWRDEVRAINIANASHSLGELLGYLHNEGHPALWYLLLYAAVHGAGTSAVVKPLSLAIAGASVFLVFRFAPFRRWEKAVFVTGLFPLFEYSVMCRNYGISMLLLFVAAILYESRFTRPVRFGIVLGLLANTNAFAFVIVFAFTIGLLLEGWTTRERGVGARGRRLLAAVGLAGAGMACAAIVMMPDPQTTATPLHRESFFVFAKELGAALVLPT